MPDGEVPHGQATGQGLHGGREAHGRDPAPAGLWGVRDPLDDWIRADGTALAGITASISRAMHARAWPPARPGAQAPLAAEVARVVNDGLDPKGAVFLEVDLDPRVLEGQVDGDLVAVDRAGRGAARRAAGDLGAEADLTGSGRPRPMSWPELLEDRAEPAGPSNTGMRGTSTCRIAGCHQERVIAVRSVSGSGIRLSRSGRTPARSRPAQVASSGSRAGSEPSTTRSMSPGLPSLPA